MAFGGLEGKGNVAQASYETFLGPAQLALQPAYERLWKPERLGQRLPRFLEKSADSRCVSITGWLLSTCVKGGAISYGIRIIPAVAVDPLAARLETCIRKVAAAIAGKGIDAAAWARLRLPGPLGGMPSRLPSLSADAAFLATCMSTRATVQVVCAELGRPARGAAAPASAVSHPEAGRQAAGADADVASGTAEMAAAQTKCASGPWGCEARARGCTAAAFAARARPWAARAFQATEPEVVREVWSQPPRHTAECMDDDHFRLALRRRLGIAPKPRKRPCARGPLVFLPRRGRALPAQRPQCAGSSRRGVRGRRGSGGREAHKLTLYGGQVSAVSAQTYGKLGAVSQANLRRVADMAASRGGVLGKSGGGLFAPWRWYLEPRWQWQRAAHVSCAAPDLTV
ncbi:unnamed protein product [Prorocentrum cordatum]|uniref:Uncharacterized protein n=1 Tax=Prorocentrum cordatum TaxID=2364126 RepID=A0ABN9UK27_9DINO|nr:unnamed protein product [Polarella glacialis]